MIEGYRIVTGKKHRWAVSKESPTKKTIYVEDLSDPTGFGCSKVAFLLDTGEIVIFVGPWSSNSTSLREDTGITDAT